MTKTELDQLKNKFWTEFYAFQSKSGPTYEGRDYIWQHSDITNGNSYWWHKMFTYSSTEIFGKVACRVSSKILGIGSCERAWGDVKHNKIGKRSHLGADRTKKQSTIYGYDSMQKAYLKRSIKKKDQPFKFWDDDDFTTALDIFVEDTKEKAKKVTARFFRAFEEDWEHAAIRKKDPVHEAKLLRKYGGLRFYDPDENVECYLSATDLQWSRPTKVGGGYMVVAYDEDYIEGADDSLEHVQPWFINGDLREVIEQYYKNKPVEGITIVSEEEEKDDGDEEKEETDEEEEEALLNTPALDTAPKKKPAKKKRGRQAKTAAKKK